MSRSSGPVWRATLVKNLLGKSWYRALQWRLAAWGRSRRRHRSLGAQGERQAARYLRKLGYHLVGQNVRMPGGELDLIAVDGRTVVFVEVKTRSSNSAGLPEEAVDIRKQKKLRRLAEIYLRRHHLETYASRLDVISIQWSDAKQEPQIRHLRAVQLDDGF